MPNVYLSLDELKASAVALGLNVNSTAGDARLLGMLDGFSRQVDRYANRQFFVTTGTKFYSGDNTTLLMVDDLVSVSTLQQDDNWDGTFNLGWTASDYHLGPYNADPTSVYGNPYTWIEVNRNSNGSRDLFDRGRRNFLISGTWGYASVTTSVGNVSASLDDTSTSFDYATGTTGKFRVGWTIEVDTEQMFIRSESGTSITVTRGVNGSTATVHASGTAISRYEYPEPVVMAVQIQAERVFKRAQGAFASDIGNPESGNFLTVRAGLDRDVQQLLDPYRKPAFGGL